jgi:hypothetical protein
MRSEDRWPGQNYDDAERTNKVASLTGREPRVTTTSRNRPALPGLPQGPIDVDYTEIPTEDGGVVIRFGGTELLANDNEYYDDDFYGNLAEEMSDAELNEVAQELLEGIESDLVSRAVWMANYEIGMSILGIEQKRPKAEATGEGISVVDHPLLLEATILYQANASAELMPASGPVKIDNSGQQTVITDQDATTLEKDMNKYLTVHRPEYVPDTERMLFQQGFGGNGFKKLFHCPIRRAPVSDAIAPGDFIVNNTATSLQNCGRKTHRIKMRPAMMKRMQFVGAYRDVDLSTPTEDITGIERKTLNIQGTRVTSDRQQDVDYTVYECHCEVDMPSDRHVVKGKETGLPRPYIVTIERDSRQILEIRRNWVDTDELFAERTRFVAFQFVPMFGFYAAGLLTILGNTTSALTAGWRIMLDKGMFSNFPGGMYLKTGARQTSNNFRAAPGEFVPVDGGGSDDIRKVVQAYPYSEPGPSTQAFFAHVEETGQRVGGAASIPVAEGKADTPVGTMLAALEQTAKMISAVHRRSHTSQSLEFQTLLELIREKPEDFIKYFESDGYWTVERLLRAIENYSLIPRADPNTPTHMHRLLKMMALKQLQQLSPDLYDVRKVDEIILQSLGFDDPQEFFAPPAAPGALPPDPTLAVAGMMQQTEQMKRASAEKVEMGKGQLAITTTQMKLESAAQLQAEKLAAAAQLQAEKESAATERELLKLSMQAETQQADHEHAAQIGEEDREHQSSEGEASRKQAVQLAKMKPAPVGKKR